MDSNWIRNCAKMTLLSAAFALQTGCGGEAEKEAVNPTEPSTAAATSDTDSDAPGGLELPPGDIPGGGSTQNADQDAEPGSSGLQMPSTGQSSAAQPATIKYASWSEVETFVKSTGKITVVDVWSTVCGPCVKEFPGLVKLHKEHGEAIQCVSMDIDYDGRKSKPPETYEEKVVGFLTKVGAEFPNFVSNTPSDEIYSTLDIVSIPAVLIFDAQGNLVKKFVDADETAGFTYEKDVVPFVTKLAG